MPALLRLPLSVKVPLGWTIVPWLFSVPPSVPPLTVMNPVLAFVSVPVSVPPEKTNRPLGKLKVAPPVPTAKVPLANCTRPLPEPV